MRGTCHAMFAHDIGFAIDLDRAARLVAEGGARQQLRHGHRAPAWFDYKPAPLRILQRGEPVRVGARETAPSVECLVFDFGAISVSYSIALEGDLDDLVALSETLYENEALLADARRRAEAILEALRPAVTGPGLVDLVEDYAVYHLESPAPGRELETWIRANARVLAQVLRSDHRALSRQETDDALACQISYGEDDAALIDWNAALLFLDDADDVRAVLEFANVELLEMRFMDDRLDDALDRAYEGLTRRHHWWHSFAVARAGGELWRVGRLQADAAVLFEGVNSALKLLGDQYLARVYQLASQRFHLPEWDVSVLRKLSALESIYQKVSDRHGTQRMEVLEWIIIALFVVSVALQLWPGGK